MKVRLVSYNIRALRDSEPAVVRVLRTLEPDVVCLQETPRFLRWRSRLAGLARRSGLLYVTGGGTVGGTGLLCSLRMDVRSRAEVLLPKTQGLHQRGLAMACFGIGPTELSVVSTHMSLDQAERVRHLAAVRAAVESFTSGDYVIAGDLNEKPDGPVWRSLAGDGPAALQDGWDVAPAGGELTFSARSPRRRIDGVFATSGVRVLSCGVLQDERLLAEYPRASDHLPVVADLEVLDP